MNKHYKRLEDGAMDEIDAAIFNGDIFHNRENIKAFRDMMARWERGLQSCEAILAEVVGDEPTWSEEELTEWDGDNITKLGFLAGCFKHKYVNDPLTGDGWIISDAKISKFAESIIQECAKIGEIKEQGFGDYDPNISVGWYMRKHFGLDEEEYLKSCPTCGAEDSGTSCGLPDCGWITGDQE